MTLAVLSTLRTSWVCPDIPIPSATDSPTNLNLQIAVFRNNARARKKSCSGNLLIEKYPRTEPDLFYLFISLKSPVNTVSIEKLPIRSERHIMQRLDPFFVCFFCKFVKNCLQLVKGSTDNKYAGHITPYRLKRRGCHPVCCRNIYRAACQVSIDNPVVFFLWKLIFHGSVTKLCEN